MAEWFHQCSIETMQLRKRRESRCDTKAGPSHKCCMARGAPRSPQCPKALEVAGVRKSLDPCAHTHQPSDVQCIPDAASEGGRRLKRSAASCEAARPGALAVLRPARASLASLRRRSACFERASLSSMTAALALATSTALAGWPASKAMQAWRAACTSRRALTEELEGADHALQQSLSLRRSVPLLALTWSSPSSFRAWMRL